MDFFKPRLKAQQLESVLALLRHKRFEVIQVGQPKRNVPAAPMSVKCRTIYRAAFPFLEVRRWYPCSTSFFSQCWCCICVLGCRWIRTLRRWRPIPQGTKVCRYNWHSAGSYNI